LDDLAAIVEAVLSTHRRGARPIGSREARIAALIVAAAVADDRINCGIDSARVCRLCSSR
jgi:hypothetical protein